jgi:hypothetical protein
MWGVHNTRLLPWNKALKCPVCGQFMSNGHMAGICPSMSGLRQDRHNNALQHLPTLLEQSNGVRWETITADFGNKPIKPFTSDTFMEPLPSIGAPFSQHGHMATRRVNAYEGLDHSSLTRCPGVLPKDVMPTQLRPPSYELDFIRLLEPRLFGRYRYV